MLNLTLYPLHEILLLTLCAVISGCESFVDVAQYGRSKLDFLQELSDFEVGTPSHDVLSDLFRRLDPAAFEEVFRNWVVELSEELQGVSGVIAIDGKTTRGSKQKDGNALHFISAFAAEAGMVLGQLASTAKKNEIADIPKLLDLLLIKGAIITCDAMGCQRSIAAKIREKEADYLLALKGNQGTLHDDVKVFFEDEISLEKCDFNEIFDGDKGRLEARKHWVCTDIDWLKKRHPNWCDLTMIGMIKASREVKGKLSESTRFYIGSKKMNAADFGHAARTHWSIENRLHWVLDVTFRDDDCRVREDYGPENFSIIKHMALNILRKAKKKDSLRVMRKKSGWDNKYLKNILNT